MPVLLSVAVRPHAITHCPREQFSHSAWSERIKHKRRTGRDVMRGLREFLGLALLCAACGSVHAEISGDVVRVGVLNDISGIFQDTNGMGSVEAARMAAEDFNGGAKNIKVEIVYADHQNKADVGSAIVRKRALPRRA